MGILDEQRRLGSSWESRLGGGQQAGHRSNPTSSVGLDRVDISAMYPEMASAPAGGQSNTPNRPQNTPTASRGPAPTIGNIGNMAAQNHMRNAQPQQSSVPGIMQGTDTRHNVPMFTNVGAPGSGPAGGGQGGAVDVTGRFNRAADIYRGMNQAREPGPRVSIPQQAGSDANQQARERLMQEIVRGVTTNQRGQRLTADGLQALTGALGRLSDDSFRYDELGAGLQNDQLMAHLRNQGTLANTQQQGLNTLAQVQAQTQGTMDTERQRAGLEAWVSDITGQTGQRQVQTQRMQEYGIEPVPLLEPMEGVDPELLQEANQVRGVATQVLGQVLAEADNPNEAMMVLLEEIDTFDPTDPQQALMRQSYQLAAGQIMQALRPRQNYADGGLVMPESPVADPMQMSSPAADPMMGGMSIQQYQQYLQMAQKMGLPPIEFEEFMQLQAQQGQAPGTPTMPEMQPNAEASGVLGFADGGLVPDVGALAGIGGGQQVDGQMVMDPNPDAPTDSIPALIDGQHPAALDSGEMVIPSDVVLYHGTKTIQGWIDAARKNAAQQGEAR